MIAAAALAALTVSLPAGDPRPELVEMAVDGRLEAAVERVEAELAAAPEPAREMGLDLLRGALLERSGRTEAAQMAYVQTIAGHGPLAPWARLRLAELQDRQGHPEVASGLITALLADGPPEELVDRALALLQRSLAGGGDCRLLGRLNGAPLGADARRRLDLLSIECSLRSGSVTAVRDRLMRFLEQDPDDRWTWEAAHEVAETLNPRRDPDLARALGKAAFAHREFEIALRLLDPTLARSANGLLLDAAERDAHYAAARSLFWLGRWSEAAERFERLAGRTLSTIFRADALHQLGRSLELDGRREEAIAAYARAASSDPVGEWAGAAELSALRLEYLHGDEVSARRRLRTMARPEKVLAYARGALFLAVSDIERERRNGVDALLAAAERTSEVADVEIDYWRGRLAELGGDRQRATDHYLGILARRPYHPYAEEAQERLARLRRQDAAVAARLDALAERGDGRSLFLASRLATDPAVGRRLAERGRMRLRLDPSWVEWLDGRAAPIASWPLWSGRRDDSVDRLLGLGLAADAPRETIRRFLGQGARLGFSGAHLLASSGAVRRSLQLAESTVERRPDDVPLPWLAPEWRALLYPLPWWAEITREASRRGIDPRLLAAILREESRFDPDAVSPASARGLAQFVLPTARRLATEIGRSDLAPLDLHDPQIAIALGAAYLAELDRRFDGDRRAVVAAYNAGEAQVDEWRRQCVTDDPAEFLSKIGFAETRAYVSRVLSSRAAYADGSEAPARSSVAEPGALE